MLIVAHLFRSTTGLAMPQCNCYLDNLSLTHSKVEDIESASISLPLGEEASTPIPEEHYAYDYPMAGWAGYKNERWGGYLDHLCNTNDENDNNN